MERNSIVILVPYFGRFPLWADFFFESAGRNTTIDFLFYTDCDHGRYRYPNIKFIKCTLQEYAEKVSRSIGFAFSPSNAYKVCDARPLFGLIHRKDFQGYDFYGWCDMDLIFGNIRKFYSESILDKYDVLSTHENRISGHLALFRNSEKNINKYLEVYRWKEALAAEPFIGIDEDGLTNAYLMTLGEKVFEKLKVPIPAKLRSIVRKIKGANLYMVEQYTTPFLPKPWLDGSVNSGQPSTWYYRDGSVGNNRDLGRDFIYLHFMNFKSSQWRHDGTSAPWEGRDDFVKATIDDMRSGGLKIDEHGIQPIGDDRGSN